MHIYKQEVIESFLGVTWKDIFLGDTTHEAAKWKHTVIIKGSDPLKMTSGE